MDRSHPCTTAQLPTPSTSRLLDEGSTLAQAPATKPPLSARGMRRTSSSGIRQGGICGDHNDLSLLLEKKKYGD